jgi:hypothetical protein
VLGRVNNMHAGRCSTCLQRIPNLPGKGRRDEASSAKSPLPLPPLLRDKYANKTHSVSMPMRTTTFQIVLGRLVTRLGPVRIRIPNVLHQYREHDKGHTLASYRIYILVQCHVGGIRCVEMWGRRTQLQFHYEPLSICTKDWQSGLWAEFRCPPQRQQLFQRQQSF